MHEILHALGLIHEQSRPDASEYIDILWQNISVGFFLRTCRNGVNVVFVAARQGDQL